MRYCDGLPATGERPLRPDERAAIARLRRRIAWRLAARLALAAASPVAASAVGIAAMALFGEPGGHLGEALEVAVALVALAGFLVGPAAALLSARDRLRDWRRLGRDLASGVAVEFGEGGRSLAVLPASERVVARDGRSADLGAFAPVGAAAIPPGAAPTYALAAEDDAREIVASGLVRRPLSAEERDEIRVHARQLRRVPWTFWLVAAWWGLGAVQWTRGADRRSPLVFVLTATLALGLWRLHRARALAARLEADAEEGWAIRATAGATSGDEGLPGSRAAWTSRGAPARWRLGAGR
jgi:hypothetical protein